RAEQRLLSTAERHGVPRLARAGVIAIPLRGESEPLPHPPEEAEGPAGSPAAHARTGPSPRSDARPGAVPASGVLGRRPHAPRRVPARAGPAAPRAPAAWGARSAAPLGARARGPPPAPGRQRRAVLPRLARAA